MEKLHQVSNGISRRDFFKLSGLAAGFLFMPDFLKKAPEEVGNEWPVLSIEALPQQISEVLQAIPQTKVDLEGNLVGPETLVSQATGTSIIAPETELMEIRWTAILQKARDLKDSFTKSHFSVTVDGISQNVQPRANGNPLVIWNLVPLDMDSYRLRGNPYVRTMNGLCFNPDYKTDNK